MKEVIMKKLLFWIVLIVGIVVLLGSCAKKDEATTAATVTFTSTTTAAGSITVGSETMSGTYVSPCYSGAEVAAAASAGQLPSDLLAMRDVLVVTSDTSISEETHAYTDTTCSTLSYYSKDGNTSFSVGVASGDYYKVTYTETSFKALVDTTAAETWWEALLSTGLTVGTELSGTGSGKNELNLFSVTSTTVQIGDDDNETYPTAMDSQVMTKQ
jgi:hypothetical protein